jgi:alpha-glucosidase
MPSSSQQWWKTAVIYQIYPRSFAESTTSPGPCPGVGTLAGVTERLDHLQWLGVDALWLSPIFRSPMADFGYDVSDYCDIDPTFGTLADFDHLLAEAHARGIKVLLDWVPNHTSDQHPWFQESRQDRTNPKADWYVWRDQPANNWHASFPKGEKAWEFDEQRGQYYLRCFLKEQPDLNWDNPQVEAAMHDTLRFWLDRGVDGFRMDVVHLIGKDLTKNDPPEAEARASTHVIYNDEPVTHERLRRIRGCSRNTPASGRASARCTCSTKQRWPTTTATTTSCTSASTSGSSGRRSCPPNCGHGWLTPCRCSGRETRGPHGCSPTTTCRAIDSVTAATNSTLAWRP